MRLSLFSPVSPLPVAQKKINWDEKGPVSGSAAGLGMVRMMQIEKCFCPKSLEEATTLLKEMGEDTRICAGGTDLFVMMRKGKVQGKYIMDLSSLQLDYIREESGKTISIGAMTTLTEIQNSLLLNREPFLFLQQAARHVGSSQIRNMATLAGNICTGIPSADAAVPLLALDASVRLLSAAGERLVPVSEFFKGPRKIDVRSDELVVEILLKNHPSEGMHTFFRKVGTRRELFISVFNTAVLIGKDPDGVVCTAGLAMGVVAPTPLKLKKTELFLLGKKLEAPVIDQALSIMQTEISPRSSHHGSEAYRRAVAEHVLRSFLIQAREA